MIRLTEKLLAWYLTDAAHSGTDVEALRKAMRSSKDEVIYAARNNHRLPAHQSV
jgi:hypothetical protein